MAGVSGAGATSLRTNLHGRYIFGMEIYKDNQLSSLINSMLLKQRNVLCLDFWEPKSIAVKIVLIDFLLNFDIETILKETV